MPKLIFDIETVGVEFDSLDDTSKKFLFLRAKDDREREVIKEELGISPLTGRIISIGVLNPETGKGAAYYQQQNGETEETDGNMTLVPCQDEKDILRRFWEVATHYDQFITFNGHSFDVPYLTIRSAALKVKPTKNLIGNRYWDKPHLDVYDRLTNFGAVRFKRSLHLWCMAFGINSSKGGEVDGPEVAQFFKDKKCREIAKYCYDDLVATKELYDYWERYMCVK